MNVLIYKDEETISKASGILFAAQVISKPESVLGLATGATALTPYKTMISIYNKGAVSFKKVTTFNLDEYYGLNPKDNTSYHTFMKENLFRHIDIDQANTHFLDGEQKDHEAECLHYEAEIEKAGGIDLQLLGIGSNGHIAFNEPADSFPSISHIVALKESTLNDNSKYFDNPDDMPRHALTMGIGSIMKAKKILIIALGAAKAKAVAAMLKGPVTPNCPASILQMHPDVTVMLDEAAASLL